MGGQSCRSSSSYIEDDRPEQLTTAALLDPIKMLVEAEEEVGLKCIRKRVMVIFYVIGEEAVPG